MAKITYRVIRNGDLYGRGAVIEEKRKGWFRTQIKRWERIPSAELAEFPGLDQWFCLETGEHALINSIRMSDMTNFYRDHSKEKS